MTAFLALVHTDLLLYLHRPVEVLTRQIRERGRDIERNISPAYLEEIQNAYFDHLKTETTAPVVVIDLGEADFQRDDSVFQKIVDLLQEPHQPGWQLRKL